MRRLGYEFSTEVNVPKPRVVTGSGETPASPKDFRTIKFPKFAVKAAFGSKAVTAEQAKELLGWKRLDARDDACCPDTSNMFGFPVRMANNDRNRPVDVGWVRTLAQEHLNRRWRMNGETVIVGNTARIISGQHRLLSVIMATLVWEEASAVDRWRKSWKTPPTMETVLVFGIPEDDDTFQTLNCGKPMGFADVLYRSDVMLAFKPGIRRDLSRVLDYAVQVVWGMTGMKDDPHNPRRTHGESMDTLTHHPKLVDAAKHVLDENRGTGRIAEVLPPGTAAGTLYMMAACDDDRQTYVGAGYRESALTLSRWSEACEFWAAVADANGAVAKATRKVINSLFVRGEDGVVKPPNVSDRLGVVVKAWNLYAAGEPVKAVETTDGKWDVQGIRVGIGGIEAVESTGVGDDTTVPPEEGGTP